MAPDSSTLAWKIPWTEEPGRLQFTGLQKVGHDWVTSLSLFTFMHWRRKWQPTHVLAWRIPGTGETGGLPSMGLRRVRHDWSDLAAAANTCTLEWNGKHKCPKIPTHGISERQASYNKMDNVCLIRLQLICILWENGNVGMETPC